MTGILGILGFGQDSIPAGFNHWRQRNHIHTLLDAGADGRDLVFLLLLGIGEDQLLDAQLFGGLLERSRIGRAPVTFGAELREAHNQVRKCLRAGVADSAAGCGGSRAAPSAARCAGGRGTACQHSKN